MGDFWVFGYGSLIWRPGFEFIAEQKARLFGRRRSLCIHSWVHRGTRERPGLVLGLDRGGSCSGMARLVEGGKRRAVVDYLREREMVTDVYQEKWVAVRLSDGSRVEALAYVVDTASQQYAGDLTVDEIVEIVRSAQGVSGRNEEYVVNTVRSLRSLGIRDHLLERVAERIAGN